MNEVFQAQLQNAIDLLVKSSAYETPLSDDVIERAGKAAAASGFMTAGAFKEAAKLNPVSTILRFIRFAYALGVSSGGGPAPVPPSPIFTASLQDPQIVVSVNPTSGWKTYAVDSGNPVESPSFSFDVVNEERLIAKSLSDAQASWNFSGDLVSSPVFDLSNGNIFTTNWSFTGGVVRDIADADHSYAIDNQRQSKITVTRLDIFESLGDVSVTYAK